MGTCIWEMNRCPLDNLWGTLGCPNLIMVVPDNKTTANFESCIPILNKELFCLFFIYKLFLIRKRPLHSEKHYNIELIYPRNTQYYLYLKDEQ